MFPRRYISPTNSTSSSHNGSSSPQNFLYHTAPRTGSFAGLYPMTSPSSPRSTPRREISSSQREAMLGGSVSEWSVRNVAESGRPNTSGTVISQMVSEVLQNPPEDVLATRKTSRTVPLPSQSMIYRQVEVSLNPILKFAGQFEGGVAVHVDVATMSITTVPQLASDHRALTEWATNPPLPSINIVHPALPWSITVHATVTYVTVRDVLCTICQSLQLPLHEEYRSFCAGIDEGYRQNPERYGRDLKRLHLLKGKTLFVGLSRTTAEAVLGGDIWRMNFQ